MLNKNYRRVGNQSLKHVKVIDQFREELTNSAAKVLGRELRIELV